VSQTLVIDVGQNHSITDRMYTVHASNSAADNCVSSFMW